jgi:hypothetical protein
MWIEHLAVVELESRKCVLQAAEQLVRCGLARWSSDDADRKLLALRSGEVLVFEENFVRRVC